MIVVRRAHCAAPVTFFSLVNNFIGEASSSRTTRISPSGQGGLALCRSCTDPIRPGEPSLPDQPYGQLRDTLEFAVFWSETVNEGIA